MGSLNVTEVLGHLLPDAPDGVRYEIRFYLDHYYIVAHYDRQELAVSRVIYKPKFWKFMDASEPEHLNEKNVRKAAESATYRLFNVILNMPQPIDKTDEQRKKLGL